MPTYSYTNFAKAATFFQRGDKPKVTDWWLKAPMKNVMVNGDSHRNMLKHAVLALNSYT
jgi:hypothetical protein